jgi:hypothetical protein
MLKKITSTGLAIGLAFGAGGAAFASSGEDVNANADLTSTLNAQLEDGELMSSQEFEAMAEQHNWHAEDLQMWAESQGMTEAEMQEWAEHSGWSEEDRAQLNLDVNANIELDNLLDSSDDEYDEEEDGVLGDLLNDLL